MKYSGIMAVLAGLIFLLLPAVAAFHPEVSVWSTGVLGAQFYALLVMVVSASIAYEKPKLD